MSGDILQAKFKKLLGDIEGIKAYINDILVLNKGTPADNVEQLIICYSCIRNTGLKIYANK